MLRRVVTPHGWSDDVDQPEVFRQYPGKDIQFVVTIN